ncbi:MAG: serine/threonine-protein kinase [Deltaproteobacteria bacterium]|nr:serine/threonine-protein kinase [Deltaproteobacteria bacterium]
MLRPGESFDKYQILEELGRGGMGAVFAAFHLGLKRKVAIKVLHPDMAANPECRARFLREGEAAARIRHRHIVDVFDVGEVNATPYLVMEFLDGQSLEQRLAQGALAPLAALDILLPVADALHSAHRAGVIHRDLKPSNIFVAQTETGEVLPKLLDFGISKITTDTGKDNLTAPLSLLGTASYMSPEQARGEGQIGPASDQYAFGLVLYEALTGVRVHRGENALSIITRIILEPIEPPTVHSPDLPAPMARIVMRMLQGKAGDRFGDMGAVVAALQACKSVEPLAAPTEVAVRRQEATPSIDSTRILPSPTTTLRRTPIEVTDRQRSPLPLAKGAIAVAVVAIATTVLLFARGTKEPPPLKRSGSSLAEQPSVAPEPATAPAAPPQLPSVPITQAQPAVNPEAAPPSPLAPPEPQTRPPKPRRKSSTLAHPTNGNTEAQKTSSPETKKDAVKEDDPWINTKLR